MNHEHRPTVSQRLRVGGALFAALHFCGGCDVSPAPITSSPPPSPASAASRAERVAIIRSTAASAASPAPGGLTATNTPAQIVPLGAGATSLTVPTNAGSITLAWDRSPDVSAVGYRIYWGAASGAYTNSAAVGNVTNATLTGLAIGFPYFFAATAYNSTGEESPYSNETTGTIPWSAPVLSIRPCIYIIEGTTVPNRTNRVQESNNLTNWQTVMLFVGGANGIWSMLVTNNAPQRFYRVKVE